MWCSNYANHHYISPQETSLFDYLQSYNGLKNPSNLDGGLEYINKTSRPRLSSTVSAARNIGLPQGLPWPLRPAPLQRTIYNFVAGDRFINLGKSLSYPVGDISTWTTMQGKGDTIERMTTADADLFNLNSQSAMVDQINWAAKVHL